jgi:uncharacterized membrane protein (DUF2068 family)
MLTAQWVAFSAVAAFWLVVGGLAVAGIVDFGLARGAAMLGLLLLGNGAAFLVAGWGAARGRRWLDYAAVALVAGNAIASLADELGVLDLASFAINIALAVLLAANIRRARKAV